MFEDARYDGLTLENREVVRTAIRIVCGANFFTRADGKVEVTNCATTAEIPQKILNRALPLAQQAIREFQQPNAYQLLMDSEAILRLKDYIEALLFEEQTKKKLRVVFLKNLDTGCAWWRCQEPVRMLNEKFGKHLHVEDTFEVNLSAFLNCDVIVVQRGLFGEITHIVDSVIQKLKIAGKKIVYEIDDDLKGIPHSNEGRFVVKQNVLRFITWLERESDAIFCTTERLKQLLGYPEKTFVLPNSFDFTPYALPKRDEQREQFVFIDWHGGTSHEPDINWIEKQLTDFIVNKKTNLEKKIEKKIIIGFQGHMPTFLDPYINRTVTAPPKFYFGADPDLRGNVHFTIKGRYDLRYIGASPIETFHADLINLQPDICICPLDPRLSFNDSKCIVGDSLVVTENGLLRIENLVEEQAQLTVSLPHAGRKITNFFRYPNRGTIRVRTKSGYEIEGTLNHKVRVSDGSWMTLAELKEGDTVEISPFSIDQINYQSFSYPLLLTKCIGRDTFANADESMLPRITINERWGRLIGYLIGDGYIHDVASIRISCSLDYPDIIQDVESLFQGIGLRTKLEIKRNSHKEGNPPSNGGKGIDVGAASKHLLDIFRFLGFSGAKAKKFAIPDIILKSPKSVIREFLRGLFEADATADKLRCSVTFCSKSKTLASQVQFILLGFGIKSKLTANWNDKYQKFYFTVRLNSKSARIFHKEIGFISEKKSSILAGHVNHVPDPRANFKDEWDWSDAIESVEHGVADVYDIEVDQDHYYLANGFVSHNSNIKFLESTVAGAATIVTSTGPFKAIPDDCAVKARTPEQFIRGMQDLILYPDKRSGMRENADRWLRERYTLQDNAKLWAEALCLVAGIDNSFLTE